MTTFSGLFSDDAVFIARLWYGKPTGSNLGYNVTVPAGAKVCRGHCLGSGGEGDNWGGGGARAWAKFPVTPGENLIAYVGLNQTSNAAGDSYIKRNDGTLLVSADRGKGDGTRGLAANSVGDFKFDGAPGVGGTGGASASDATEPFSLGIGGAGITQGGTVAAEFGGGGHNVYFADENGVFLAFVPYAAGTGLVCLEFFDSDPGY